MYLKRLSGFIVILICCVFPSPIYAEQLPKELRDIIVMAATENTIHSIKLVGQTNLDQPIVNYKLEAAVIEAISIYPSLSNSILLESIKQAPNARQSLIELVTTMYPGLMQNSALKTDKARYHTHNYENVDQRKYTIDEASKGVETLSTDWPIILKEGEEDKYSELDPLEGLNKIFFYTNGALDFVLFEPLAKTYRWVAPQFIKQPIRNLFDNLSEPTNFANDLFQLRFAQAATTFSRFAVNSTIGIFGLFDIASNLDLHKSDNDFGKTLYSYGVGDGIYVVLPFFGPTTVRDSLSIGIDSFFDIRGWLLKPTPRIATSVSEGIVRREVLIEPINFLVKNSDNPYQAVRAWTYQKRAAELAVK